MYNKKQQAFSVQVCLRLFTFNSQKWEILENKTKILTALTLCLQPVEFFH